jgi:magnesium-transporting ATPase (P-type)
VIFGVVLLNSIIGFVQEGKALSALAALSRALTTTATVLRAGEKQQVDAGELVPGDIVLLVSGDKVPADLRLLRSRNLQIDESALTGESLPVEKQSGDLAHDVVLAERNNMAYSSSLVTYGTGLGVVTDTGDATEIGRISELIASAEVLATPLTRKIARFSHVLLYVILVLAGLTFATGLWHGGSAVDMFMAAVAMAVAMIPEGLPGGKNKKSCLRSWPNCCDRRFKHAGNVLANASKALRNRTVSRDFEVAKKSDFTSCFY